MFDYTKKFYNPDDFDTPEDEIVEEEVIEEEEIIEEEPYNEVEDEEDPEPEDKTCFGIVTCDKLNVRKGPGTHYDIATKPVSKGEELMIMGGFDSDWYEVCTASGVEGYVLKDHIKIS